MRAAGENFWIFGSMDPNLAIYIVNTVTIAVVQNDAFLGPKCNDAKLSAAGENFGFFGFQIGQSLK